MDLGGEVAGGCWWAFWFVLGFFWLFVSDELEPKLSGSLKLKKKKNKGG